MNIRLAILAASVAVGMLMLESSRAIAQEPSPREIQQALSDHGFNPGTPDGKWGKRSISALRSFQKENGLNPSGSLDRASLEALFPQNQMSGDTTTRVSDHNGAQITTPAPSDEPAQKPDSSALPTSSGPMQQSVGQQAETVPTDQSSSTTTLPAASTIPEPPATARPVSRPSSTGEQSEGGGGFLAFLLFAGIAIFLYRRRAKRRAAVAAATSTGWSPAYESVVSSDPLREKQGNSVSTTSDLRVSSDSHDTQVKEWVSNRAAFGNRSALASPAPMMQEPIAANANSPWIFRGVETSVAGTKISGGMIYVGGSLLKQGRGSENENCLINPKLAVSSTGDPYGQTLGYWPSYSSITPAARRTYLDWLAGSRSDPSTPIGYVFIYFYGLERRLMLEPNPPDGEAVISEVRRLLPIYGDNGSFNQYANQLLSAWQLRASLPAADHIPEGAGNGFEVPTPIKIALGMRVRDGREIEPDLLLQYALSHPETRVRTPAKRAAMLHRALFVAEVKKKHPNGLRIAAGRAKSVKMDYRACSGSFTVSVEAAGGTIPDITGRAEPITFARTVFESCSDQLDEYSRALGRSAGLSPTLMSISKLPEFLRRTAANALPEDTLGIIDRYAVTRSVMSLSELGKLSGVEIGSSPTKPKLREMSQVLAAFGLGNTSDPNYALRSSSVEEAVIVFPLEDGKAVDPTDNFRAAQLSSTLGMLVGYADDHFHELEKQALLESVHANAALSNDDKTRLAAEIEIHQQDPSRLDEWVKRLKDVPAAGKDIIANELVVVAASDGNVHPSEVKKLESLFKRMGLGNDSLYARLHEESQRVRGEADEDLELIVAPGIQEIGSPIPASPREIVAQTINLDRLNSIRNETRVTALALAEIFKEDEVLEAVPPAPQDHGSDQGDVFEGLERRYGSLLIELRNSETWSASDFEQLVRIAGLMPGAAKQAINDWSLDRFDELLIEGDEPLVINLYLIPSDAQQSPGFGQSAEGIPA
ncbi:hypothetical protein GFM44_30920 [Rhizobium leguminosarum bv. viciae]|nr:hypothetical protein [Rhizobium leguminosarum bv. viciae]